jgi:hypothetical protein
VKFLDANGGAAPASDRPDHAQLGIGAIDGAISGMPTRNFRVLDLNAAEDITVAPKDMAKALAHEAATLTPTALQSGLRITPADARIARASTVLISQLKVPLVTGFFDSASRNGLFLVFFDRPCRLSGTVSTKEPWTTPSEYVWDVDVPKAGAEWLEVRQTGTARYEVKRMTRPPSPMIVTAPLEDYQNGMVRFRP